MRSPRRTVLKSDESILKKPGPRKEFLGRFPKSACVAAGANSLAVKQGVLIAEWPQTVWILGSSTSASTTPPKLPDREVPLLMTLNGVPVCALTVVPTDQSAEDRVHEPVLALDRHFPDKVRS